MTAPANEEIMARRQAWANAALADPLLTPERRCYGTYSQKDLSSGQQTNCYVGVGFLATLPPNVALDADLIFDQITGAYNRVLHAILCFERNQKVLRPQHWLSQRTHQHERPRIRR